MSTVNLGQLRMDHGLIVIADTSLPVSHWQGVSNVQGRWAVDFECADTDEAARLAKRYGHAQEVEVLADGCARVICPNMRSAGHIATQAKAYLVDNQIRDVAVTAHALKESAHQGRDAARQNGVGVSQGAVWVRAGSARVTAEVNDAGEVESITIRVNG